MSTNERLHALDAVRGFALLLGIALHATMSFFLPIPAADSSPSTALAVAFYVIHVFRMSLFYVVAGFFAHMLLHRRGTRAFVKDRAKRILVPMIGGWVILAPITIVILVWGVSRTFGDALPEDLDQGQSGFPLMHLWFLYYLCIFYALALAGRWVLERWLDRTGKLRQRLDRIVRAVLPSYAAPLVLAAPLALVLANRDGWIAAGGIPTPDVGLAPQLPAMLGFGTAFAAGWLLNRQTELLGAWKARWPVLLTLAAVLTIGCLMLVEPSADYLAAPAELGPAAKLAYAFAYCTAIWCWSFGIIGAALRFCSEHSAVRRYLADSSYWLYLAHLPLVFLLQVLVADWPLHWTIKFPLILATATAVLLVSYHYLVRPTFVGEILNGRKYPRGPRSTDPGAPGPDRPRGSRTTSGEVLSLEAVSKSYGATTALDGLTLDVRRGELLALLGPNGAGKTTAIALSLGLLEPDAGHVRLMGQSPLETASRLGVGMMLQEVNLAPELRVRQHIKLVSSYYPAPMPIDEVLAMTGTAEIAGKRYKKLSSGQKRRVQFATAVCGRPKLLFLDEPTVGLDIRAREAMWRTIRSLVDEGCSIVLTTHYLEEAEALADRVAVVAHGKLIAVGSVDEMRSLVSRKQIRCVSTVAAEDVRSWPGVVEAARDETSLEITAFDAEAVVRRLLAADESLSNLEVKQASLAEAFTEITKEAA